MWKQLLHTKQTAVTLNHNNSNFYLAENGFKDPLSELEATISAFLQTPKNQCQFPARKRFIAEHLPTLHFPDVAYPQYEEYLNTFSTPSIAKFSPFPQTEGCHAILIS